MGIKLNGATSGSVELDVPAAIGSDIDFTLPGADGSSGQVLGTNGAGALSFINRVEWDQFQLDAHVTSDGTLTNWIRSPHPSFGQVGTQMSASSGIFTFPSTGYYLVIARPNFNIDDSDTLIMRTEVTTDNSTYLLEGFASDGNNGSGLRHGSGTSFTFVDVTDTSQVKVKFVANSIGSGSQFSGDASTPYTQVTFVRLGDT
tara:strand:- start:1516 stop:2121 length:606 start_codon:yes stop_codon:yes gene_type:complete